ncbi:MAG TPA: DUF4136 domain-containing protein [Pyrinomonadaceae bacterium]|nr:DUF4136 domain-containing protein [Pyrinomonadaceae bacterium]
MRIARVTGVLVSVLIMFAAAARAQSVQTDFDRSFNFSQLKTFNFVPQRRPPGDPLAGDSLNSGRISSVLESKLTASGFRQVSDARPDFAVAYYVTTREKLDVQDYSIGPGRFFGRRDIRVDQFTEGTLIVDFIDTNTRQLVWRGRASGAVELKKLDEKITKAVEKLVNQFLKDTRRGGGK